MKNTHAATTSAAAVALSLLGPAATGQPIDLTVDPAQSSIEISIELVTALGNRTSSDDSAIEGDVSIELIPTPGLTQIDLLDYSFVAQSGLSFVFDYSFAGSVTADATGLGLRMPALAPAATGTVDAGNAISIVGVPSETVGVLDASGTGLIGGTIGMVSIDLATLGETMVDVSGTIEIAGDQVTVTVTVPIDTTNEVQDGVIANITGSASVVATGTIEPPCPADTNGDGLLTPADFSGWVIAFNSQAPACDQNGDGLCTPGDFSAWVINFNAGCP